MAVYKKIFLKRKNISDNLNVVLVEESFKKIPKVDLSYSYKFKFNKGNLYLRDGLVNIMIVDKYNLLEWLDLLKIFVERCLKLEKIREKVEIDFPVTTRTKGNNYYSYFFRFKNKKLYMDVREGYTEYKKEIVNYLIENKMKNLIVREVPLEKLVKLVKSVQEVNKKDKVKNVKKIKQILNKVDKIKKKW